MNKAIRCGAERLGLDVRVAAVAGDNLTGQESSVIDAATADMFDGSSIREKVASADQINSLVAYGASLRSGYALPA